METRNESGLEKPATFNSAHVQKAHVLSGHGNRLNVILYNNEKINVSKSAKYLGVQIDNDFNFKSHIQLLHNKLSRAVGIMFKVKNFFLKKY